MKSTYLLPLFLALMVADEVAMANDEKLNNFVYCYASNQSSPAKECIVRSDHYAVLVCPVNGRWYKRENSHWTCPNSNCTLPIEKTENPIKLSFLEDAGNYYCHQDGGGLEYAVNLKVLGDPEFVSFKDQSYKKKSGNYSPIAVGPHRGYYAFVSVQTVGVGPFNVSWWFNDKRIDCSSSSHNCSELKINETSVRFTYTLHQPFDASMNGVYLAEVSNAYGSKYARVGFTYSCSPPNLPLPIKPSINQRKVEKSLQEGDVLELECAAAVESGDYLGVCYGYSWENFTYILQNNWSERCSSCEIGGECNNFLHVLNFNATFDEHGGDCSSHTVKLRIGGLERKVNYTFYCWAGASGDLNGIKPFGEYEVSVLPRKNNSNFWHMGKWVVPACGAFLLILLVIAMVVALQIHVRRKRKRSSYEEISDSEEEKVENENQDAISIERDRSAINRERLNGRGCNGNVHRDPIYQSTCSLCEEVKSTSDMYLQHQYNSATRSV